MTVTGSGVSSRSPFALHPGVRTGTVYYPSPSVLPSSATAAVSTNVLYFQPIALNGTINRIGIEVTTGAAGEARLGLFRNNNGIPGALMLDAGTVDTTNIALVEITLSNLVLTGEWLWMGAVFNATPTCRCGTVGLTMLIGAGTTSAGNRSIIGSHTYAALPATAPAISGFSSAGPMVWLRNV